MLLSLSEARQIVIARAMAIEHPLGTESVFLEGALGRTLAVDVVADRDQPPFRRCLRDGFALRAADATPGATLSCVGEIAAGGTFAGRLAPGECVEIMTGAAAPDEADLVVMIEDVTVKERRVTLNASLTPDALRPGQWSVAPGAELAAGAIAVPKGARLGAAHISALAAVGMTHPQVTRPPRVAFLPTGDELVPVDQVPGPIQIRNANTLGLAAQAMLAGAIPLQQMIAADDPVLLRDLADDALARADVVVLVGGISKGKHDYVADVLASLGVTMEFRGVALKPGKPVAFGHLSRRLVFALPGNPISALLTSALFVVPALEILSGRPEPTWPLTEARLGVAIPGRPNAMTQFLPARIDASIDAVTAHPLLSQSSGDIPSLARANGFIVIPPQTGALGVGTTVRILPL